MENSVSTREKISYGVSYEEDGRFLLEKTPCKVYYDGSHFVATPIIKSLLPKETRYPAFRGDLDEHFEESFRESVRKQIAKRERRAWIQEHMHENFGDVLQYDDEWMDKKMEQQLHNLLNKRKRFRRKAYLNPWSYFVTITYDGKKMTEEEFRQSCKRTFNNFHTRRGWKYMGVFERGEENDRLHFHALVYVPEGQMPGKMKPVKRYSEREKRMKVMLENSFFREAYGINTFDVIQKETFGNGKLINYILKYILKDGEKIIYARGVPTELEQLVGDERIAAEMIDFVTKFVLYDERETLYTEPEEENPLGKQGTEVRLRN